MTIDQPIFKNAQPPVLTLDRPVVAIVLQPNERELFLPPLEESRFPAEIRYVDTTTTDWERFLREARPSVLVTGWSTPPIPLEWGLAADCPLRLVAHVPGTVRRLVPRPLLERGLLVTNWGSSIAYTVAEHALLMALGLLRGLALWRPSMERPMTLHELMRTVRTKSLRGRRVGIHGFGAVARELVAMLRPHRVDLRVYSQPVPRDFYAENGVTPAETLADLFAHSEILFECEALTPATEGTVTAPLLASLPDDAIFINVARARLVDEDALLAQAQSGRLRVGLDVFNREPLPLESPWFQVPGALLSPHIAGPTLDAFQHCGEMALENVARYLAGAPLANVVTLAAYDAAT